MTVKNKNNYDNHATFYKAYNFIDWKIYIIVRLDMLGEKYGKIFEWKSRYWHMLTFILNILGALIVYVRVCVCVCDDLIV